MENHPRQKVVDKPGFQNSPRVIPSIDGLDVINMVISHLSVGWSEKSTVIFPRNMFIWVAFPPYVACGSMCHGQRIVHWFESSIPVCGNPEKPGI